MQKECLTLSCKLEAGKLLSGTGLTPHVQESSCRLGHSSTVLPGSPQGGSRRRSPPHTHTNAASYLYPFTFRTQKGDPLKKTTALLAGMTLFQEFFISSLGCQWDQAPSGQALLFVEMETAPLEAALTKT